jgi:uncharacterized protein YodC (DUF2158 family)
METSNKVYMQPGDVV